MAGGVNLDSINMKLMMDSSQSPQLLSNSLDQTLDQCGEKSIATTTMNNQQSPRPVNYIPPFMSLKREQALDQVKSLVYP